MILSIFERFQEVTVIEYVVILALSILLPIAFISLSKKQTSKRNLPYNKKFHIILSVIYFLFGFIAMIATVLSRYGTLLFQTVPVIWFVIVYLAIETIVIYKFFFKDEDKFEYLLYRVICVFLPCMIAATLMGMLHLLQIWFG